MFTTNNKLDQKSPMKQLNIFVFQPDGTPSAGKNSATGFYNLTFDEKLSILNEKIIMVKKYIKTNSISEKNIFVAPEFLFKNFKKQASERYYSKGEKNLFKQTLIDLSKDTDLILAPGTICWKNRSKTDHQVYFRNMIYFVHRGTVTKYRKYNTAPSETDFWSDYQGNAGYVTGIEHFYRKGHFYKRDLFSYYVSDNNVVTIGDLIIGIEICNDNNNEQLKTCLNKGNQKVELHLIVAGGLPEVQILKEKALLTVKIDANHNWDKFPKTISLDNQSAETNTIKTYNNPVKTTGELVRIEDNLECHQFKY